MRIDVQFDASQLSAAVLDRARQLPFAIANAMNRTMEEAQTAVKERIRMRGFTIRSGATDRWLTNQVKINRGERATKANLLVTLRIGSGAGAGNVDAGSFTGKSLLAFEEAGGERVGARAIGTGGTFGPSIVVPIRTTPGEIIPRALYPINLGLVPRRQIAGGFSHATLEGKRGTFAISTGAGQGLILQRYGPGKDDVRVLFLIRQHAHVAGRHFFYDVAKRVILERFAANLAGMYAAALKTAR